MLAVGGAVCLGVGASENAAVQAAPDDSPWPDYAGRLDAANALVISGSVAAGVGVVGVVLGAVMIATTPSSSTRVAVGPGSLTIGGRF